MINSLDQLVEHDIQDLYSAENQLVVALEEMIIESTAVNLKDALQNHLAETKQHIERLDEVSKILAISPKGEECVGIKGLIDEGKSILKEIEVEEIKDMAIVGACQKVEHYEMAAYEDVILQLDILGNPEALSILIDTLNEENIASKRLSEIANENSIINGMEPTEDEGDGLGGAGGIATTETTSNEVLADDNILPSY